MALSSLFTIATLSILVAVQARSELQDSAVATKQVARQINEGYYYVASVYPFATTTWEGECFQHNSAYVTYTQDHALGYVVVTASDARSWACKDYYKFKVGDQTVATDSFFSSFSPHEVAFDSSDRQLRKSVKQQGVQVYLYRSGNNGACNEAENTLKLVQSSENGNYES